MEDPKNWQFWYRCKPVRVTDGDSVICLIDKGLSTFMHCRLRFAGVDAPETRSPDEAERLRGQTSKTALIKKIRPYLLSTEEDSLDFKSPSTCILHSLKFEKYGRVLGHLYLPGSNESLSEWLLKEGLAKPWE